MSEKLLNASAPVGLEQLIVFKLNKQEFGVAIEKVQEILKIGQITPIPEAPKFIVGLVNVRGDIVPVIDLCTRFNMPLCEDIAKHIVLTKQDNNLMALIVDEVCEVLRISADDIKPAPKILQHVQREFVDGVISYDGRLIILLNLTAILSESELVKFYQAQTKELLKKTKNNIKSKISHDAGGRNEG